ncbi:heavy-metal-associated domain-containing protein [Thiomicrorhabdus sediminis]|uniref:heavy-metal-associated domain-containing protein n=1 Tax=Thiomicrorhabdus sediminis TaxID=2580412 RepID=UPI001EE908CF|nr:heavy metal-associated domain-containing protein [Thiomicrorhabdus sediminis]
MTSLQVENIKCGGCAGNIKQSLSKLDGIESVAVDIEAGQVSCEFSADADQVAVLAQVKDKLLAMGYPEQGSVEGLASVGAKAKSYVSCAIGKMASDDKQ